MDQDLFPGFASRWVEASTGRFFVRTGGDGPPIVLLHGFPQTHACWHRVGPALANRFTVIAMDLRGYGASAAPPGNGYDTYSKRAMAMDVIDVAEQLGHKRFSVAGHDRGARVSYRLALDHPRRVEALALLDIVPTTIVWQQIRAGTFPAPHWQFLARPYPKPENEIGGDPLTYFEGLLSKWSQSGSLASFAPGALASYRASYQENARIHAFCEDYRAGASSDVEADDSDVRLGKRIVCPTLVIWSEYLLRGATSAFEDPLSVWRRTFAPQALEVRVQAGHFIAEEDPRSVIAALNAFF